ncbi:MAG: BofC C-terminal domain-containing protein [Oscillospiraceae bacterium]|nr:BofC C-terminal domain-containing protein [Oscillospiraceae bacterium]
MEHSFAGALATLLLTGSIVFGFYALEDHFKPKENETSAKTEISASEKAGTEKAVLGVFEGRLALFKGESPYPNTVYDFYVRNLPKEDQSRLSEGIFVSSESELESLLEDFMS